MVVEANEVEIFDIRQKINIQPISPDESRSAGMENAGAEGQRIDYIYDDEPLGLEKDLVASTMKLQPQDPLEEIDFGDGANKRLVYISANIDPSMRIKVISLLQEYKDYFAWDYNEMSDLRRDLVVLKLPIKPGKSQSSNCQDGLRKKSCQK